MTMEQMRTFLAVADCLNFKSSRTIIFVSAYRQQTNSVFGRRM